MPDTQHLERNLATVSDRRAHARRPVSSFAYIELGEKNGGVVRDVSQNGLAVQAAEPLAEGQSLPVRFRLPNTGIWIQTTGRVAWQGKSARAGGIQFIDLPDDAKVEIDRWISTGGKHVGTTRERSRTSAPAQTLSAANLPLPERTHIPVKSGSRNMTEPPAPERPESFVPHEAGTGRPDLNLSARNSSAGRWLRGPDPVAQTPTPHDIYEEPRGRGYRIPAQLPPGFERVDRKRHGWGMAAAVGALVVLLVVLGVTVAPQDLPENIVQQITSFISRYTRSSGQSQDATGASTNAANAGGATASVPRKDSDTDQDLPAHQNPLAASPLNSSTPLELQPQEAPPGPKEAEAASDRSTSKGGTALADEGRPSKPSAEIKALRLEARRAQVEKKRKEIAEIAAREKRETPRDRALQNTGISRSLSGRPVLRTVAARSTEDAPGQYSSDGFLDLPETPVSASSEFAITTRRTIPLRYPAGPEPGYSGQSLKIGSLVYHVDPIYPDQALSNHVQGMVELHATIGADGNVESVEPVSGPIPLIPAAMGAVRQWQYGRTLHFGQPIPTEADIDIVFRLP